MAARPIDPDFRYYLDFKSRELISLFADLRQYILDLYPDTNELVYHTHALTAVFSISDKLSDAFCMIPIYTNHLNLGFNKGTLSKDPHTLLTGTGTLIRHIDVQSPKDYRNPKVRALIKEAIDFAIRDMDKPSKKPGADHLQDQARLSIYIIYDICCGLGTGNDDRFGEQSLEIPPACIIFKPWR